MQRRGFERDYMRSRSQQRRGWDDQGERFRSRYDDSPGGGARRSEEAYDDTGDFEPMGFEDSDERAWSGGGSQRERDRYGRQSRAGVGSSRGLGYAGQPGGARDYAHGGLGGYQSGLGGVGRPSGEGFFRRAPVGQWSDDLGGPHGGRGPEGYKRGDDRIREDVCDQLTQHSYLDASCIRVEVKDGEVTLSGTVQSREEKRLAEDLAESARGVGEVRNDLRVQAQIGRAGESPSRHTIGTPHGGDSHAGAPDKQKGQSGDR